MGVEPTTPAPQTPTIQIAEFRLHDELLSKTITVPVKRLSALLCNYRMLACIMVELSYGRLSILGHSLRNKIPIVGNQGESEGYDRRGAKKTPLFLVPLAGI